jgi:hypothetical protein
MPEVSRLLSLPAELRLEIWTYTLTDPTIDKPVLHILLESTGFITPGRRSRNLLQWNGGMRVPHVAVSFDEPRPEASDVSNPLHLQGSAPNLMRLGQALPL